MRLPRGQTSTSEYVGLALALILALVTLGLAIWDEPLHIDELRQVGYYERSLEGIVQGASSQTQPPLDYLVGGLAQRLLGPSDVTWRLQGFLFAWFGLLLLGTLLVRTGKRAWIAIGLLALSPVFLEISSYARPYALPFFLMVLLVWSFDGWMRSRRRAYLVSGGLSAVTLPLARTTEPTLFLLSTALVLLAVRLKNGKEAGSWVRWPIVLSLVGVSISALVLPHVEIARFQAESGILGLDRIVSRLWSQIIPAHVELAPLGVVGFLGGIVGVGVAGWLFVRRGEADYWWILPIALTSMIAPIGFAALSVPWVPYFDRYTYFAAPTLAIGITFTLGLLRSETWINLLGITLLAVASVPAVLSLTETHNPDYKRAGEVVTPLIEAGNVVLYEQDASLARYRPAGFPGVPIYISRTRPVLSTEFVARERFSIEPGKRPLILIKSLSEEIEGWTEVKIADDFHILVPDREPKEWNALEQADALWMACMGLQPQNGSYLCVSAVKILYDSGESTLANSYADATLERIENSAVRQRVGHFLNGILGDPAPEG